MFHDPFLQGGNPFLTTKTSDTSRFAGQPDGGLIVTQSGPGIFHRELIIRLAAQHRLPAVYSLRNDVTHGGLISYGPDRIDQFRKAAPNNAFA